MEISLPKWQDKFENKISKLAYANLVADFNKAIKIYEGYCRTEDDVLYEVYSDLLDKIRPSILALNQVEWHELDLMATKLAVAAEVSIGDGLKATFLYDLVAVIRG